MNYFVTGATGFIGRFLIGELLDRDGTIYVLCRPGSVEKVDDLRARWGVDDGRIVPVLGDLADERLGVDPHQFPAEIDHFFHLAAIYDLTADADRQHVANVEGTRHAVHLAEALGARHFHLASSIAAAGLYRGTFTEDMFDEAEDVDNNPYYRTKHESEAVVRTECTVPWRIYRPGVVVGHSQTGEIDKIDGPYYFFRTLQRIRGVLPSWVRGVGLEGGPINIVPVDYVAAALDHIAHVDRLDGQVFHLVDPEPLSVGQLTKVFARAAGAPSVAVRVDTQWLSRIRLPRVPLVDGLVDLALAELGIPRPILHYLNYPTRFDSANAQRALQGSGITVPPLPSYAGVLWEYWERTFSPGGRDHALSRAVRGKVVLITGASSGIGRAAALKIGAAGGTVLLVARTPEKLEPTRADIEASGGTAHVHRCDLSDVDDVERLAKDVLDRHGRVDILVNNAGRSIRRSIALSYDRFHDFERTMQLNYFGAVRLILALLPAMRAGTEGRRGGHIINVSSIGVQTNTPRFSAYVASKAALDAFSRCIASEVIDDGVHLTTIHMPLVRTPMIAPTRMYGRFPAITPSDAADLIGKAIVRRPKKIGTTLGNVGELSYAVAPKAVDTVLNIAYKLFPDSQAARGGPERDRPIRTSDEPSSEGVAFAHLMRGIHW